MANDRDFVVTPTLNAGGKVQWEMCRMENGQKQDCGKNNGSYPNVTLDANKGAYNFKVTITGDTTNLGIKFADNALSIKKGEPNGPGLPKQIDSANGGGTKVLTFTDHNSLPSKANPNPVTISYGLNFTDKDGNAVTGIDPDITNGGTNRFEFADYLMPAAVGFFAGIVLTILYRKFVMGRARQG